MKSRLHRHSIPDRLARSKSLYRLSYPGPRKEQNERDIERIYTTVICSEKLNVRTVDCLLYEIWSSDRGNYAE